MQENGHGRVVWFGAIGLGDRPTVGGKGASLGELQRAQIDVPPGFVVTTHAFREFVRETGSATSREAIETATIPAAIAADVANAYARLCADAGDATLPVAVRSSATAEDGADASFAGLQDTYLWIRGEDNVLGALRRCWASLYSEPAIAYRSRLDLREEDMAMGVVVQRMVEPRSAGVMFTRSPVSGDMSVVVISASFGLGSTVVGGDVTPDEFVVNKITGLLQRSTISRKETRHVPLESGSGTREEPIPEEMQSLASLEATELAALCDVGRRIERHYGCPQDIEWAIDAGGALFILQSRPETVWSARDRAAAEAARIAPAAKPFDHVFSFFGTRKP
jgi:pyruvate,water dikinase